MKLFLIVQAYSVSLGWRQRLVPEFRASEIKQRLSKTCLNRLTILLLNNNLADPAHGLEPYDGNSNTIELI